MASGFVVASAGYAALSFTGGLLALALLAALLVERRRGTRSVQADHPAPG